MNKDDMDLLSKGVDTWNEWRSGHTESRPDLSRADLSGKNLAHVNFSNVMLKHTNLSGANLFCADLSESILDGADLKGAILIGANFSNAQMNGVNTAGAELAFTLFYQTNGVPNDLQKRINEERLYVGVMSHTSLTHEVLRLKAITHESERTIGDRIDSHFVSRARDIDAMRNQYEQLLEGLSSLQRQMPDVGIGKQAKSFEELADQHGTGTKLWFRLTSGLLCAAVILAVLDVLANIFGWLPVSQDYVPLIASKVILYSLLSFGIIWGSKNYRAEKHNLTVARHRATALRTFPALFDSVRTEEFREAILLFAAEAAYRDRPTGYDNKEPDSKHVNPIINEFVKAAAKNLPGPNPKGVS